MASTVTVRQRGRPAAKGHPKVTLTTPAATLTLPITNPEATHSNLGPDWIEISRPGQRPLLRNAGMRLRRMRLDVMFKTPTGGAVEPDLVKLVVMSTATAPVQVAYGPFEAGPWRIAEIDIRSVKRAIHSNHIKLAEVRIELVEALGDNITLPSAQKPPKDSSTPSAPTAGRPAAPAKTHTVRSGDTLSKIAAQHCGNANHWPKIAKANKLRNPNRIYPGQKLTIPC